MKKCLLIPCLLFLLLFSQQIIAQNITNIYVNPNEGNDLNDGSKEHPLRSLVAASKLVNSSEGENPVTIYL